MQRTTSQIVGTTLLIVLFIKVHTASGLNLKMIQPTMPAGGKRIVLLGECVELLCTYTLGAGEDQNLTMTKDDKDIIPSDEEPHVIETNLTVGRNLSLRLCIHNVTYEDSGKYDCKHKDAGNYDLTIEVIKVVTESFFVKPKVKTAILMCKIVHNSSYASKPLPTTWFRKIRTGEFAEVMSGNNITVSQEKLIITGVDYKKNEHLGEYMCEVRPASNARFENYTVAINAAAGVEPMPESKKGVHGSRMEVDFRIYGFPLEITWTYNNEPLMSDARRYVGVDSAVHHSLVNNTLTFTSLEYSDRGSYVCNVSNAYGSKSSEIFIRIKDPVIVLWPILGILVQVVILFLIIFFCEKRKKKAEGHSPARTSHDNPAIQDDENVRRRYAPGASRAVDNT